MWLLAVAQNTAAAASASNTDVKVALIGIAGVALTAFSGYLIARRDDKSSDSSTSTLINHEGRLVEHSGRLDDLEAQMGEVFRRLGLRRDDGTRDPGGTAVPRTRSDSGDHRQYQDPSPD